MDFNKHYAVGLSAIDSGKNYALSLKAYQENVPLVIKFAKKYNIPIVTNPQLVEILEMLSVEQTIPKELLPALDLIMNRIEER
jgi:type III secretion system FlhB-like substrate exporter